MDYMMNKFMNIAYPLLIIFQLVLYPPYLVYQLLGFTKRSIFRENVAGKVVLITGASSGIGEHVAYEYAKKGARLALAARREDRLQVVADKARKLGSPDVITITADVSKVEDCKRCVKETMSHYEKLDHLVNNAGIIQTGLLEDCTNTSDFAPTMDINFWGYVNCTRFALPHLKKNKGKIVAIVSTAVWSPVPRMTFYNASKGAIMSFFETLRVECGSHIGITIVIPGVVESEFTTKETLRKLNYKGFPPIESTEECAKAIVESARRGDMYLMEPAWMKSVYLIKILFPELCEWAFRKAAL